ncbi:MAG: FlgD immunoglobulin-like domain containing protein, partial [bacterium]
DSQLANIKAGMAYWVKVQAPTTIDVSKSQPQPPTPFTGSTAYSITLDAGWNQIANPFVYPIEWGNVMVNYGGQVKGWLDAVNSGWLRSYIFYWNPNSSAYEWSVSGSYLLQPWAGYFIKVTVPSTLIFPAIPSRNLAYGEGITSSAREISVDWLIQLVLLGGGVRDEANFIGVGKELKVEKPPSPLDSYVNIVKDGERLACDVRSSTAQKVWTIEVNAPQGGEIIWKGMERLPKGLRLYLIDENGNRIYMGTTSSYKVEGKRILKIEAVEGNGKAMIIGLRVVPQRGGVSVAFSLSAEAMVSAKVMTASGKAVKILGQRSLQAGANSIYWDGKDEKGNPLPAGVYIIEVLARGTDGEFSRAIQMFNLR